MLIVSLITLMSSEMIVNTAQKVLRYEIGEKMSCTSNDWHKFHNCSWFCQEITFKSMENAEQIYIILIVNL